MDLFNKKAIKRLFEAQIEVRENQIEIVKRLEKLEARKYFTPYDALPEDSIEYIFSKHLKAIIDFLGIKIEHGLEEDVNCIRPAPQMRRVCRAVKIKKNNKRK